MKNEIAQNQKMKIEIIEIPALKPKEFGLSIKEGNKIAKAFNEDSLKLETLTLEYNSLVKKEVSPEIELKAAELDKKLQKVNLSVNKIHKIEKSSFLSSGCYCDALKNQNIKPIEKMRIKTKEIANYTKNRIKKEQDELDIIRKAELIANGVQSFALPADLGEMDKEVYDLYLQGVKATYLNKQEADKKEKARIAIGAEQKAAEQVKKDEKTAKTNKENAILKAKNDKIEKELRDKIHAENVEKAKIAAKKEAEFAKGDSEKFGDFLNDLKGLKTKYTFKSAKHKKKYSDACKLIDRTLKRINK